MFRPVIPPRLRNIIFDPSSSTVNVQEQTITLHLDEYHELLNPYCKDENLDHFFMYIYKVKQCREKRAHVWTECLFAHHGEKARRRDPMKFPYQGIICPEFRLQGQCKMGPNCEFSHGIFEFWLHPSRYRTRLCEAGLLCPRKVCFFAHSMEQLRPASIDDSASSSKVTKMVMLNASSSKGSHKDDPGDIYSEYPHMDMILAVFSDD